MVLGEVSLNKVNLTMHHVIHLTAISVCLIQLNLLSFMDVMQFGNAFLSL